MELIEFLQKEKESCTNEFVTYGIVLFRVLPLSATVLLAIYVYSDEAITNKIILIMPFIMIIFFVVLALFTLLTYSADLCRRMYERAINKLFAGEICFRFKDMHNVIFNHGRKVKYSIEVFLMSTSLALMVIYFYILSSIEALEIIESNISYYLYMSAVIVLPIIALTCSGRLVNRLTITSAKKEEELSSFISSISEGLKI